MKKLIWGAIVIGLLALILGTKTDYNQFSGYGQMVEHITKKPEPAKAHDLDLSKYRPHFTPGN